MTHAFNQTQRFVPLSFTASTGALTVQAPPSGNLAPPGPYMLFLIDTQGVPSVAAMVRVVAGVADTTPPTVPGNLQAAAAGSSVGLTWTASTDSSGVSGYDVHRSSTSGFTPSVGNRIAQPPTTSHTDTPPAPGTYYYKVAARDTSGNVSGPSNQAAATVTSGGPSSIVLRQHAGRDAGTTTSASLAFPSANTAGSLIAVAVRAGKKGQSITVTDSRGNTYRRAFQTDLALDTVTFALYYAENAAAGTNTVTVTDTVHGGTLRFAILEYAGVAASNALAETSAIAEGSSGSATSPSTAAGTAGSLVMGLFSVADTATLTATGGAALQASVPAAPFTKLAVTGRIQAAVGSASASATVFPSQPWAAAVAVFRAGSP